MNRTFAFAPKSPKGDFLHPDLAASKSSLGDLGAKAKV